MVNNKETSRCIIIFTEGRKTLTQSLNSLNNVDIDIIVIDDSVNPVKDANSDYYMKNNVFYHCRNEQKLILNNINSNLGRFVSPLGASYWSLGYVRNYAIILSKILGYKQVLFMDDDITIKNSDTVEIIMDKLNDYDFIGAQISGMPDYSITDKLADLCGLKHGMSETPSGGFLAFNLSAVSEYFLNYYNEDMIWIYLHHPNTKILKYGEVYQQPYNIFENGIERASKQTFGEVLIRGVYAAFEQRKNSVLLQNTFWEDTLNEEIECIKKIDRLCKEKEIESIGIDICNEVLSHLSNLHPDDFVKIFVNYFKRKKVWIDNLNKLKDNSYYNSINIHNSKGCKNARK